MTATAARLARLERSTRARRLEHDLNTGRRRIEELGDGELELLAGNLDPGTRASLRRLDDAALLRLSRGEDLAQNGTG